MQFGRRTARPLPMRRRQVTSRADQGFDSERSCADYMFSYKKRRVMPRTDALGGARRGCRFLTPVTNVLTMVVLPWLFFATVVASAATPHLQQRFTARPMENLGRGVVAVRASDTDIFISWRLLGLDPNNLSFNIYRSTDCAAATRINANVLTRGANYLDKDANLAKSNTYFVRSVLNGKEESATSSMFILEANTAKGPLIRVPIRAGSLIKYVWVGDLTSTGEYGFVIDRQDAQQGLEAYSGNGTFLWKVDMGPNSRNQDNIKPGSSTINVGHWDGVTVYDLDSDGFAEVVVRIANGVVFGDGEVFNDGKNDDEQFIAVLDGQTGTLRAAMKIPNEHIEHGLFAARLGIGYLDGVTPHVVGWFKNRRDDKNFNRTIAA